MMPCTELGLTIIFWAYIWCSPAKQGGLPGITEEEILLNCVGIPFASVKEEKKN